MLAALTTLPAFAVASHKSPPGVPDCSALSRGAIANLIGTGPLALEKKVGNLCAFSGHRPGHYKPGLVIQIVPWSKKLFSVAERDCRVLGRKGSSQFGVVSSALKVGKGAFFVTGTMTSASRGKCGSEEAPARRRRKYAPAQSVPVNPRSRTSCGRLRTLAQRRRADGVSRWRCSAGRHLVDSRDHPGQGPHLWQDPLSRAGSRA